MHAHVIRDGASEASRITVGRGVSGDVAAVVAGVSTSPRRATVLCQPSTRAIAEAQVSALSRIGLEANGYAVPDGEAAKRMGVVEDVYRHLNTSGFTRDDVVVAVGGGALTDLAGFVAGTYLRGVPVVYVPTTLLGAVDASVGGKTGVNVDGKNLAGVFKHPEHVIIDVDILDRLPEVQLREGAAEAIKAGFIADPGIVEAYERAGLAVDLEEVVDRAVSVKVAVVNEDFREHGRRAILNYGHTVGHAVETASGRSHGASVAIGMVAAGEASAQVLGFTGGDRQQAVLDMVGLPIDANELTAEVVRPLMDLDKKRDSTGLRMVLLRDIADPEVHPVDDATVRAALDAVGIA